MTALSIVVAYAAGVTLLLLAFAAVVALQWRRIGRLSERLGEVRARAHEHEIKLDAATARNAALVDENVRLLHLTVDIDEGSEP